MSTEDQLVQQFDVVHNAVYTDWNTARQNQINSKTQQNHQELRDFVQ